VVGASPTGRVDGGAKQNDGAVEFGRRRGKPVSGEDEFIKPGIGEERREEGPPPAMAAVVASPRDSRVVTGPPVVELGQEGSGKGDPWGELVVNSDTRGEEN
jgi:hypothetical protein